MHLRPFIFNLLLCCPFLSLRSFSSFNSSLYPFSPLLPLSFPLRPSLFSLHPFLFPQFFFLSSFRFSSLPTPHLHSFSSPFSLPFFLLYSSFTLPFLLLYSSFSLTSLLLYSSFPQLFLLFYSSLPFLLLLGSGPKGDDVQ